MFVFHMISGASGAGPAEKRVKDASPSNCGHSYWSKLPLLAVASTSPKALEVPSARLCIFEDRIKPERINRRISADRVQSFEILISEPQSSMTKPDHNAASNLFSPTIKQDLFYYKRYGIWVKDWTFNDFWVLTASQAIRKVGQVIRIIFFRVWEF